jgi:hypothetical protein
VYTLYRSFLLTIIFHAKMFHTFRHQGWNDGCSEEMTAEYEYNLANLIRDLRIDLGVVNLPVSIGVSGMVGYSSSPDDRPDPRRDGIIAAQFAMMNATKYPEFAGTVEAVETRGYARDPAPHSPSQQGYHWNGNCESYWLVGKSMGEAMLRLLGIQNNNNSKGGFPEPGIGLAETRAQQLRQVVVA